MLKDKVKDLRSLRRILITLRKSGKKIVFTNGCFDLIHLGHVKYLESAKQKGDILVVAINSDSSMRKIKGSKRPIVRQEDRLKIVAGLESVDFVTLFHETTPLNVIKALLPDILVKGSDWKNKPIIGKDFLDSYNGKTITINFLFGRSTTNLINKIVKKFG